MTLEERQEMARIRKEAIERTPQILEETFGPVFEKLFAKKLEEELQKEEQE